MTKNNTVNNKNDKQNIIDALHAFDSMSLPEAGVGLFSVLGYDTNLRDLNQQSYNEFKNLYIDGSPNGPRFNEEKALIDDWGSVAILFQLTDDSFSGMSSLFDSSVDTNSIKSYVCLSLELKNSTYSKTQIANVTREVNKIFAMPIIMIIKYGVNVTIAIINRRVNKRDNDRDVLEKVTLIKDIAYKNPHRAHVEILFDLSLPQLRANQKYEINSFTSLHKAWSEVLDIQVLNKRFYTELSNWYFWAIKTVVYPGYEMEAEQNSLFTKRDKVREHNAKNLIRLLTRLLFVWFIKEKGLIPEEFFDENKIQQIIINFEPEYKKNRDRSADAVSVYYKAILQNLFFASLNAEQGKRAFRIDGQNQNATNLMRYKRFHNNPDAFVKTIEAKVPFMNGGLFDCLDHQDDILKGPRGGAIVKYEDGFSDRPDNELFVPDYIFFGKEVKVDLSSEYDDKKKKDVVTNGIINILQKYKFTIAENTPIEEDIALDPELLGRVFENLLASYNPETQTNARKQTGSFYTPRPIVEYMVDESLKAYLKAKIIDESNCNAEVEKSLNRKLDALIAYNDKDPEFSENDRKKILKFLDDCRILDPACGSGAFPMGILQKMVYVIHKLDPNNYNWKLLQVEKITSNKDLSAKEKTELIAEITSTFTDNELDYARKLYLIENCIHGIDIQPVATQISRLRFFISLIVDQTVDSSKYNFGIRPLPNLENRFVTANSLIGLNNERTNLSDEIIEPLLVKLAKVRHQIFNIKTPKRKFELKLEDKKIRAELEQKLMELGFGRENARLLSTWDPYDKNKSADFFDAEWMFGIKDGFDIVMGNPPYVNANQLKKTLGEEKYNKLKSFFLTAKGTVDFYVYFFEKGIKLLKSKGILSYITPNKYLCANYGVALREYFLNNTQILNLWDISDSQCFDASVYPIVTTIQKKHEKNYKFTVETRDGIHLCYNSESLTMLPENIWGFLLSDKFPIVKKIINSSENLASVCLINATSTASEADKFHNYISKSTGKRLINTGTIDPYVSLWGLKALIDKGAEFLNPYLKNDKKILGEYRYKMYNSPKIIFAKMAKKVEAFLDNDGSYASINTNCLYNFKIDSRLLLGWVHSSIFNFVYEVFFDGLRMSGGYLPYSAPYLSCMYIPKFSKETEKEIVKLVDKILTEKEKNNNADISNYRTKIDDVLFKLYNLDGKDINTIKGGDV